MPLNPQNPNEVQQFYTQAVNAGGDPSQVQQYIQKRIQETTPTPTAQSSGESLPDTPPTLDGFVQNAGNNLGSIVSGVAQYPGKYIQSLISTGTPDAFMGKLALGAAKNLGETAGINFEDKTGKPALGWSPQNILEHAYNKPVDTLLNLLPFLGIAKGALAGVGEGAEAVDAASQGAKASATIGDAAEGAADSSKAINGIKQVNPVVGRMATDSVGVSNLRNVTASENAAVDAIKQTSANTPRGMARQLEASIPKLGDQINQTAKSVDAKIGPTPFDSANDAIMNSVKDSDAYVTTADIKPKLYQRVESEVGNLIQDGNMPDISGNPEGLGATSISKLNDARMALNSKIPQSWFQNEMPLSTDSDALNSMRWNASNAIKKYITDTSGAENVGDLINQQHIAFQQKAVLAKNALKGSGVATNIPLQAVPSYVTNKILGFGKVPLTRAMVNGFSLGNVSGDVSGALPLLSSNSTTQDLNNQDAQANNSVTSENNNESANGNANNQLNSGTNHTYPSDPGNVQMGEQPNQTGSLGSIAQATAQMQGNTNGSNQTELSQTPGSSPSDSTNGSFLNPLGWDPARLYRAANRAFQAHDMRNYEYLSSMAQMELSNQRYLHPKMTGRSATLLGNTQVAINQVSDLTKTLDKTYGSVMGPIQGRIRSYDPAGPVGAYESRMNVLSQSIAQATGGDQKTIYNELPSITDTPVRAKQKLNSLLGVLKDDLKTRTEYLKNSSDIGVGASPADAGVGE